MKNSKLTILGTVAVAALSISSAQAMDKSGHFTSHHLVDEKNYETAAAKLPAEEKLELREYLNYEQREPCQFYQPIPNGFVREGCHLVPERQERMVRKSQTVVYKTEPTKDLAVNNVITDYEVNFAFDSAAIEPAAGGTLDQVAREIKKYNPREVTVSGHADKAGPSDYNVALSERRANSVSNALTERGITNRILDEEAHGEMDPAINTKDGVALRENRRVVVEFRK
jgi:outer membrane protein OmpA-like peptidoglycan-associated protein